MLSTRWQIAGQGQGSSFRGTPMDGSDPLGFNGGDTNLYRYVGNSPANHTDPDGTRAEEPWRLDLHDHGGPHIQKGKLRWSAETLEPLEHLKVTPPKLTRSQLEEL